MKNKNLIRIFTFNQSFHWFMTGLMIPILTLLLLKKGLDLFQIGIALGLYSGIVILFELPTGGLADSIGRKRVYLISLVASITAMTFLLFARSFITLSTGFVFMGIARALSSGTMDAWFVDEFRKNDINGNLQAAFAKVGIFIPLGLGAGAILGGVLPMSLGKMTARLPNFDIYSANILVVLFLGILQIYLTSKLIHDPRSEASHSGILNGLKEFPRVISDSIQYGFKNRIVLLLALSTGAWGLGISGVELLWQPQTKIILGSDSQTWIFGLMSAGYFVASALGSFIASPLCKFFNNNYQGVLAGARFLMGGTLFILALQAEIIGFIGFYWGLFIFNGIMNSPHAAIFNDNIPEEQRSTLLSFESVVMQMGGVLGSIGLGYLSQSFSIAIAWFVGAGVLAFSSLFYIFLPKQTAKIPV
ncbi:MAG: MFS transporter [Anaerolineales bacterium]|uniref:MFS transporter n=1 Tax=Candidatus Desulfolinea nitratireducens TaxID=2841698 RepID=A0A8J6NGX1_9CHLR|nr:MFS transporter [Candidatus Desulfolinea nitratireducens]